MDALTCLLTVQHTSLVLIALRTYPIPWVTGTPYRRHVRAHCSHCSSSFPGHCTPTAAQSLHTAPLAKPTAGVYPAWRASAFTRVARPPPRAPRAPRQAHHAGLHSRGSPHSHSPAQPSSNINCTWLLTTLSSHKQLNLSNSSPARVAHACQPLGS